MTGREPIAVVHGRVGPAVGLRKPGSAVRLPRARLVDGPAARASSAKSNGARLARGRQFPRHDLDGLGGIRVAVTRGINLVERPPHARERRGVEDARRHWYRELVSLTDVTGIGRARDDDVTIHHRLAHDLG